MNILKHELRLYKKSTIIWISSLVGIVILFSMIYPTFASSGDLIDKMMDNFPKAMRDALGLGSMSLSDPLGFYGFMFMYIALTASVQAMNLGLSVLSNELMDKTADFLMAKPVKRIQIVHAKLSASLIIIMITNIVFFVAAKISMDVASPTSYSFKVFALMNGSMLLIQLFFLALGMFVSVFMDKMKTVVPISLGIVFAFFVLNLLNDALPDRPLTALTPFGYFSTGKIFESGSYQMTWFSLNLVLVVLFIIGAYIRFIKRDIPSV